MSGISLASLSRGTGSHVFLREVEYGDTVRPSFRSMYRVMLWKTMAVAWKRWRIQSVIISALIYNAIVLFAWRSSSVVLGKTVEGADPKEQHLVMLEIFRMLAPVMLTSSMGSVLATVVAEVVSEKESKMKVVQLVYGVPPWVYWAAYVTYTLFIGAGGSALWTITLSITCFEGVNPFLVFVTLVLNYVQVFCVAVAFATIFDRVRTASTFVSLTFYLGLVPPILMTSVPSLPDYVVYLTGFLPLMGISWWTGSVVMLAISGHAWDWGPNFLRRPEVYPLMPGRPELPPPGYLFLMYFLQVGAWILFAYWFDQVWQGEFGAAKPWNFCLRPSYLWPSRFRRPSSADLGDDGAPPDAESARPPLELCGLTKVFYGPKKWGQPRSEHRAVDGMTLKMRQGELFALLGHNGSGKTTAINCITGMIPITSGEGFIMGHSCTTDIDRCRWNITICPQDNPMYDELNVDQHLRLFGGLRGSQNPDSEIPQVITALGLTDKRYAECKALSGGQKRRLWVATALMGQAPVVFLDEPTSGMDPASRRELWDLLVDMKHRGRSIMFTTHYLEEADVLADRKAVLARGRVQALGTSRELKMKFGVGYHLILHLPRGFRPGSVREVRRLVQEMVSGSSEENIQEEERVQSHDAPVEFRFTLPYNAVDGFGPLLTEIERKSEELELLDYEVAMTSLEEVFMALGKEADELDAAGRGALEFQDLEQDQDEGERVQLCWEEQALIMFRLRMAETFSDRRVTYYSVIVPLGLSVYGFYASMGFKQDGNAMLGNVSQWPGMSVCFTCLPFLTRMVRERQTKVRYVMISQGLSPSAYWAATISQVCLQTLIISLAFPVLAMVTDQEFQTRGRILLIWAAAFLSPVPAVLFFANLALVFRTEESAMKLAPMISIFLGLLPPLVPGILWTVSTAGTCDDYAKIFHWLFSFVDPLYLVAGSFLGAWRAGGPPQEGMGLVGDGGADWVWNEMAWAPFLGQACLSLYLLRNLLGHGGTLGGGAAGNGSGSEPPGPTGPGRRDSDVLAEESRVRLTVPQREACLFHGLHHTYGSGGNRGEAVRAVRGISLGVQRGECFGLLGPNGAGKTTTLACLTGEIRPPTRGEVFVSGHSVTGDGLFEAYKHLANCPQVDPIFPTLSGRTHLVFYGRLKGIPEGLVHRRVDRLLQRLGFDPADRDKPAGKYSGGMKRKLSVGVALIGCNEILFLDEPSAAVDAGARRLLWKVIKMRPSGKTVVITTHSMEEAEAVCDRLAIQVVGQLRCLGTPLHLKSKYGSGYQLEILLQRQPRSSDSGTGQNSADKSSRSQALKHFVETVLSPECTLIEKHGRRYLYQLPPLHSSGLSLGQVFARLQASREDQGIEDYSLARPSLEQVFLRFAREQDEGHQAETAVDLSGRQPEEETA